MKPVVKYMTWSGLIAIVPVVVSILQIDKVLDERHDKYIQGWHDRNPYAYRISEADARFILRTEALTIAEANALKQSVGDFGSLARTTAEKVDVILLQSAEQTALAREAKLERLESNPENSTEWRDRRREAKADFDRAVAYRNCLRRNQTGEDCDRLRGW